MKKRTWIAYLVFELFLIGLIPLDLLMINVPTWIIFCGIAINAIFIIRVWLKVSAKIVYKISITILILLNISISLFGVYCNPYWNSYSLKASNSLTKEYDAEISYEKAVEDLDYVMKYVKKDHPVFLEGSYDHQHMRMRCLS